MQLRLSCGQRNTWGRKRCPSGSDWRQMSSVRVPRVHSGHPQTDAIHNTNPIGNIFSNKYAVEHSKLLLVIWQMLEKMYDRNGKKRVSLRSRGTLQQRQHRWKIAATRLCGVTMRYRNCHEIGYWPIIECEPESIVIPSFVPVFCILTTGPADFTTGPADFTTGPAVLRNWSDRFTKLARLILQMARPFLKLARPILQLARPFLKLARPVLILAWPILRRKSFVSMMLR